MIARLPDSWVVIGTFVLIVIVIACVYVTHKGPDDD